MSKLRILLSVLTIFAISLFIFCFANNITYRSTEVFSYYFNDTRVLEEIHTTISVNEMADEITGYLNSYGNDYFSVKEDTGYDLEDVFTESEGMNMLKVKRALRHSAIICLISFTYTICVYFFFVRENYADILRTCYKISMPLSLGMIGLELRTCMNPGNTYRIFDVLRFNELNKDAGLCLILDENFLYFATIIFTVIALICFIAVTVLVFRITKPNNMFYKGK